MKKAKIQIIEDELIIARDTQMTLEKFIELRKLISEIINILNSIIEKKVDSKTLSTRLTEFYEQIKHYLKLYESNPKNIPAIKDKQQIIEKLTQIMNEHKIRPIKPIGQILVEMGVVDNQTIEEAIRYQKGTNDVQGNILDIFDEKKKDIRIDADKFDKLFEYIEEINALGGLLSNVDVQSDDFDPDDFENLLFQFNTQMSNFQQFAYSVRVISLDRLFNKIKRLVNQLSRNLNKQVELVIEDSLMNRIDKDIIEKITYPLVHLIRNSVDHGIESKDERLRKNKPQTGTISLTSINKSNEIWISVKDDGKGLDKDKILNTAIKRGLVKENDISTMSEKEIYNLIFESGFSTSDNVTEISGRGVGMDVVNKNLEELRGKIEIKTEKDKGSEFILKIPLSLMEVLSVVINKYRYSIPVNNITEIFSYRDTKTVKLEDDKEIVKLEDKTIPLIRLNDDLYKDTEIEKNKTNINVNAIDGLQKNDAIIIINKNNKTIGLYADVIEQIQQASIKSPGRYAKKNKKILGLSILGSGEITIILDIDEIIKEHLR
jgi:two-component system, chemotaxis family, sensor kinase CheA